MTYFFIGGVVLLALLAAVQGLRSLGRRTRWRLLRWATGGGAAIVTILLLLARRFDLAMFAGAAAYGILARGRLGNFSLDGPEMEGENRSGVRSRYLAMELDHDSGAVLGEVVSGQFAGADLIDLDADQTRALIAEVQHDPDSLSLLETWLDANRSGWREYFAEQDGEGTGQAGPGAAADPLEEARAVLGLKPGASAGEIRAAHRELMKGVHPDHGGSSYLAAKINAARDRLLKELGE